MKPAPFPHRYHVRFEGKRLVAPPRERIAVGAPVQFGGTDDVWSPEHLLVGATLECLWTTFQAFARRDGLAHYELEGHGTGILDKAHDGPMFTSITLEIELWVDASDHDRAARLIESAEANCIVSRALRVPVVVHTQVHERAPVEKSA